MYRMAFSASALESYSTKQNPHAVFFILSRPKMIFFMSALLWRARRFVLQLYERKDFLHTMCSFSLLSLFFTVTPEGLVSVLAQVDIEVAGHCLQEATWLQCREVAKGATRRMRLFCFLSVYWEICIHVFLVLQCITGLGGWELHGMWAPGCDVNSANNVCFYETWEAEGRREDLVFFLQGGHMGFVRCEFLQKPVKPLAITYLGVVGQRDR